MSTNLSGKIRPFFECKSCYYVTSCSKDYKKHLQTKKHFRNSSQQSATKKSVFCENCQKQYKDRTGLWRHKRTCIVTENCDDEKELDKIDIMTILKDNTEIQKMMMEVIKNGTNNTNCNNTTNKTFNLNVYLNETCKDAMNITDFVNSINLSLEDLENTGKKGYVEGISTIFLKNLNSIEDHMRPIHCSDQKREILYIKDNNKWAKECCDERPILTKAIKNVANQNIKQIKYWMDKNPNCISSESRKNDLYLKIVSNSMNGLTEDESKKNINKIISNVAKEVIIGKGF